MYSPQDLADRVKMHPLTVREYLDDFDIQTPGWEGWSKEEFDDIAEIVVEGSRKKAPIQIKIGADPEFEVHGKTGNIISASRYFSGTSSADQVGVDGASHTGELRPKPGSPERVTSNIRKLMKKVKDTLPAGFNVGAGSGKNHPLGGHIHISGRPQSEILLDKFEQFITQPLNAKSSTTDLRRSYGSPRSWRIQPHGWEYRSPCSWLAHPVITRGALVIAYTLCGMTDIQLTKIKTQDDLIKSIGNIRGKFVYQFWAFLESITSLESIDVFRAWQIKDEIVSSEQLLEVTSTVIPNSTWVMVNMEDDNMLPFESMNLSAGSPRLATTLVGARRSRRPTTPCVFVPGTWDMSEFVMPSVASRDFPVGNNGYERWNMQTLGLSWSLRSRVVNSSWRTGNNRRNSVFNRTKVHLQEILDARLRLMSRANRN